MQNQKKAKSFLFSGSLRLSESIQYLTQSKDNLTHFILTIDKEANYVFKDIHYQLFTDVNSSLQKANKLKDWTQLLVDNKSN